MIGLLPQDQIEHYKQLYGNIYSIEILGHFFIFRELRRGEFKDIDLLDIDDGSKEDEICRRCVLYPEVFGEDLYYGCVYTTLSHHILRASGFTDPDFIAGKVRQYRESYQDFEAKYDALILAAFQNFKISDIEKMSTDEYLRYLAAAEFILVHFKGVHPDILKEIHKSPQSQSNVQFSERNIIPPGTKMPREARQELSERGAQVGTVDPVSGLPRVYGSPARHYGDADGAIKQYQGKRQGYQRPG